MSNKTLCSNNILLENRISSITKKNIVVACFFMMLMTNGLAAYNISGIPIPWFSYIFAFIGLIIISYHKRIMFPPGTKFLLLLIAYAILVQIVRLFQNEQYILPTLMTTRYPVFISIRYLILFGFLVAMIFTYMIALVYGIDAIIKSILIIMVLLSLSALYIYAAQLFGYWEPPRNRMGTGGQDFLRNQVTYQYLFHRATGTFLEPSHLAQWLVFPLLLVLSSNNYKNLLIMAIGLVALILTGSLLGVISFVAGILVFMYLIKFDIKKWMYIILIITGGIAGLEYILNIDFIGAITPRVISLLDGGVEASNRDYIYEYLTSQTPSMLGYGIGNSNIIFSNYLGSNLIASHISLFVNIWFSLGIIGFVLILLFVLSPVYSRYIWINATRSALSASLLAGVFSWFICFLAHAEELQVMFAVAYGLIRANEKIMRSSEMDIKNVKEIHRITSHV